MLRFWIRGSWVRKLQNKVLCLPDLTTRDVQPEGATA